MSSNIRDFFVVRTLKVAHHAARKAAKEVEILLLERGVDSELASEARLTFIVSVRNHTKTIRWPNLT
jgi:hypothetical protein